MISLAAIFEIFKTGKTPTESQFKDTWSSFWHKSEKIPQTQVFGLNELKSFVINDSGAFVADKSVKFTDVVVSSSVGSLSFQIGGDVYDADTLVGVVLPPKEQLVFLISPKVGSYYAATAVYFDYI